MRGSALTRGGEDFLSWRRGGHRRARSTGRNSEACRRVAERPWPGAQASPRPTSRTPIRRTFQGPEATFSTGTVFTCTILVEIVNSWASGASCPCLGVWPLCPPRLTWARGPQAHLEWGDATPFLLLLITAARAPAPFTSGRWGPPEAGPSPRL